MNEKWIEFFILLKMVRMNNFFLEKTKLRIETCLISTLNDMIWNEMKWYDFYIYYFDIPVAVVALAVSNEF